MLKLDSGLKADLLAQPESGMGYQIVEATDFNGRIQRGVAYNAELLLFDEEQPGVGATRLPQVIVPQNNSFSASVAPKSDEGGSDGEMVAGGRMRCPRFI